MSFLSTLAQHIKDTYDLRKEELTVVFPNKRAAFYLRQRFQSLYQEDIWLPQMLSIEEALTQWSGIRMADNVDTLFELISIDSELYSKQADHGGSITVFGSMAAQMAKDFDEIDQYHVDAEHLFSYVNDMKRLGLWVPGDDITQKEREYLRFFENLKNYYLRLRERLERQGKGYYGMITRKLAEMSEEELKERVQGRKVIFAGFNALTPTERIIIDKLYRVQCAEVVWDFDRYYVEDEHNEAGSFARQYIKKNVPWKPTVFSDSLLNDEKEIYFVKACGNTVQAKALQSLLQADEEKQVNVILADEKLMIPVLNCIPDQERYNSVKVSMGYPIRQTALSHFVNEFFTLHRKGRKVKDKGWYLWPILHVLETELTQVIFSAQELKELGQYRASIAKDSTFVYQTTDFESHCKSHDLRQFMDLLLGEGDIQRPIQLVETLRGLLTFIANKIQQSAETDKMLFLLNQVSEIGKALNRLKSIMERYEDYVNDLDELEVLFHLVTANASLKLNSSSTKGFQLMGLLEARNLDFDTFYMVGVNEGVIPANKSYNSFIPYNIRKECGLPDDSEKQAVYAYHFYRQLQGARKITFIYDSNGTKSGGEPSRFLLQLKHELVKRNPKIKLTEMVFANKVPKAHVTQLLTANKTEEVMAKMMRKIQPEEDYRALAPTSLATYIQCPMRFYLHYLMDIKDDSAEEETQSNVIGSVVHNTLEDLYKDYLNTTITPALFDQIKSRLDATLDKVIQKKFSQGLPNVGYNYLSKLNIDKLLKNYVRYETEQLKANTHARPDALHGNGLSILGVEQLLRTELMVDGISCVIAGTADCIECRDGIVRIIDYKTGSVDSKDVKVAENTETVRDIPEKAMQLLIYKYLYLKNHPGTDPDRVTAALFALRSSQVRFDLNIEYEPLKEHFIETMEGFLREVLHAMMDRNQPFTQPTDTLVKPCHFCDFKALCANTEAGERLANDR